MHSSLDCILECSPERYVECILEIYVHVCIPEIDLNEIENTIQKSSQKGRGVGRR
jgi:hypothetical protein